MSAPSIDPAPSSVTSRLQLAEAVREACLNAALQAYEAAGISGLCGEGRWEIAVQALRYFDLRPLVTAHERESPHGERQR